MVCRDKSPPAPIPLALTAVDIWLALNLVSVSLPPITLIDSWALIEIEPALPTLDVLAEINPPFVIVN